MTPEARSISNHWIMVANRQTVEPRGGAQIVVNGELFKLRQGGLMGYYPDFIFPKLAEARKRMMPKMVTAYYLRVFRGPPIGALYRSYPGPWQVKPPGSLDPQSLSSLQSLYNVAPNHQFRQLRQAKACLDSSISPISAPALVAIAVAFLPCFPPNPTFPLILHLAIHPSHCEKTSFCSTRSVI
jgi:hypothetical protein